MVPFRATRWLTNGNDFDAMKTELCHVICTDVKFRVERQVVKLESRMITLSVNRDLSTGINCYWKISVYYPWRKEGGWADSR